MNNSKFKKNAVVKYIIQNGGMLIALLLFAVILSVTTSAFLTGRNLINVLRQISINAVIAFGMTSVLLIGGIDLSVGSVVAASGSLTVILVTVVGVPFGVAILLGLILGLVFGLLNGLIITKGKLPPFIVTLAMMTIIRGIAYIITGGKPSRIDNDVFNEIGNGHIWSIPVPIIIMVAVFIVCGILLNKTRLGRSIYAVGGNEQAALFSGIKIDRVKIFVYTLSGFFSAISGLILASRLKAGQPMVGEGYELDAIAAVVLGGTSFTGGVGRVGGTILGALVIGVLSNGLNLLQIPFYWQLVVKGIVILLAVYIDTVKRNSKGSSFKKKRESSESKGEESN